MRGWSNQEDEDRRTQVGLQIFFFWICFLWRGEAVRAILSPFVCLLGIKYVWYLSPFVFWAYLIDKTKKGFMLWSDKTNCRETLCYVQRARCKHVLNPTFRNSAVITNIFSRVPHRQSIKYPFGYELRKKIENILFSLIICVYILAWWSLTKNISNPQIRNVGPQGKRDMGVRKRRRLRCRSAEARNRPGPVEHKSGNA